MHIFLSRHRMAIAISSVLVLLVCCQPTNNQVSTVSTSPPSLEVVALKDKTAKPEAEKADLRSTAAALFGELEAAATASDETRALAALERLETKYPSSSESAAGAKRVANMVADREKKAREANRIASLAVAPKGKTAKPEAENIELRNTAAALFGELEAAATASDETRALAALERLETKYPSSSESAAGAKRVAKLVADREKKERQANRIAPLGLKALAVSPKFTGDDVTVSVEAPAIQKEWVIDAYDSHYRFQEAKKGSSFVTTKISAFSKSKNPRLPGVGVYVASGTKLKKIGTIEYRFAGWDDYPSHMGNNADYRNDFVNSTTISFFHWRRVSR